MAYIAASVTAYELLKTRLRTGHYPPGSCLRAAEIADELGVSVTPAREGLIRLAVEGLAEEVQRHGFFVPKLTEADLHEFYELNLNYAIIAIARADLGILAEYPPIERRFASLPDCKGNGQVADQLVVETEALFNHLVLASRNHYMCLGLKNLNDRLFLARRHEGHILSGISDELQTLWKLCGGGNKTGLRKAICRYHQRRFHILGELIGCINRSWVSTSKRVDVI